MREVQGSAVATFWRDCRTSPQAAAVLSKYRQHPNRAARTAHGRRLARHVNEWPTNGRISGVDLPHKRWIRTHLSLWIGTVLSRQIWRADVSLTAHRDLKTRGPRIREAIASRLKVEGNLPARRRSSASASQTTSVATGLRHRKGCPTRVSGHTNARTRRVPQGAGDQTERDRRLIAARSPSKQKWRHSRDTPKPQARRSKTSSGIAHRTASSQHDRDDTIFGNVVSWSSAGVNGPRLAQSTLAAQRPRGRRAQGYGERHAGVPVRARPGLGPRISARALAATGFTNLAHQGISADPQNGCRPRSEPG